MSLHFVEQPNAHRQLLPLTYTRPIADLRVGILTIAQKWSARLNEKEISFHSEKYLQQKFKEKPADQKAFWIVNGLLPTNNLVSAILHLQKGEALSVDNQIIAARGERSPINEESIYHQIPFGNSISQISYSWDIFSLNGQEIRSDYELITSGRTSQPLNDPHTKTYGSNIFLEEGASVKAAILNAESGPIYIGKNTKIEEGAIIRGPFGVGKGCTIKIGAKIRENTSAGPHCNLGGEISNVVFWGYSNKGHDGFLGNAVLGEWCNLGADTNNSNLKNNYDPVRMWDYASSKFIHTGLQFCGLVMGDHSKCGINTMFNTGTTVGVAANIFGEGFPRNIIPSFAWGGASGFVTHQPRKAFITADIVMQRRKLTLTEEDKGILNHIFESSAQYRVWEIK